MLICGNWIQPWKEGPCGILCNIYVPSSELLDQKLNWSLCGKAYKNTFFQFSFFFSQCIFALLSHFLLGQYSLLNCLEPVFPALFGVVWIWKVLGQGCGVALLLMCCLVTENNINKCTIQKNPKHYVCWKMLSSFFCFKLLPLDPLSKKEILPLLLLPPLLTRWWISIGCLSTWK